MLTRCSSILRRVEFICFFFGRHQQFKASKSAAEWTNVKFQHINNVFHFRQKCARFLARLWVEDKEWKIYDVFLAAARAYHKSTIFVVYVKLLKTQFEIGQQLFFPTRFSISLDASLDDNHLRTSTTRSNWLNIYSIFFRNHVIGQAFSLGVQTLIRNEN